MLLRRRALSPAIVGLAVLLVLVIVWHRSHEAIRGTLRERSLDLVMPLLPVPPSPGPEVVIVDIDRAALARFGTWPWPRGRLAALVAAVADGRPAAFALDMLLAGPDRFSDNGDAALAQALARVPSVLGFVLETTASGQALPATPILANAPVSVTDIWRASGIVGPTPLLADGAQGFGALAMAADIDGPIRRVPLLVMVGDAVRPGLALELVRLAQGAGGLLLMPGGILHVGDSAVPLGQDAMLRLTRVARIRAISATRLVTEPASRAELAGRAVLIGSSAPELGGLRVTPASPVTASVVIQAEAADAMLRGTVLARPAWVELAELVAALALGGMCLSLALCLRPAIGASCALLLCLVWSGAATTAAPGLRLLVDPAGPALIAFVTFVAAVLARFARDEWRARLLRMSFEQHLAPDVVRRIAADPAALRLRGEMREITALFTDIEGLPA